MNQTTAPRSAFFFRLSFVFLAVALTGFSTTFFFPLARGTFSAPPVIHVHGALLFGWLLLFIAQATLVRARRVQLHRQLGVAGAVLALGIVVSGFAVGLYATRRDLAATGGDLERGQFINVLIEMLVFGSLVGAAVRFRRDPESHKRLLVLANISVLGPAWLRFRHFLPSVGNPFVVFSLVADSVLLVVIARDWWAHQRVHKVYWWAGGAMLAVHLIELTCGQSAAWVRMARWLLGEGPA